MTDNGIAWGLWALGRSLTHPGDRKTGAINLYFLWSVERVGVLCNLNTIGGTDWYRWGIKYLLPSQRTDGSWFGNGYLGSDPALDTAFALLFLKKSDLLPDLRKTLKKYVNIVDPGSVDKQILAKLKAGKYPDVKKLIAKNNPNLSLKLGVLQAKIPTAKKIRIRGPSSFRISGIRSKGLAVEAKADKDEAITHEMTLTITPEKTGDFHHTIYLQTNIPGRSEVPVRIEAKVRK